MKLVRVLERYSLSECIIDISHITLCKIRIMKKSKGLLDLQGVQLSNPIQLFQLFLNPFTHKHCKC